MTQEEEDLFRSEFKHIVYLKGMIVSDAQFHITLIGWNKNCSHDDAILKQLSKLNKTKQDFKDSLKGRSYEEWKAASAMLSKLRAAIKAAKSRKTINEKLLEAHLQKYKEFKL